MASACKDLVFIIHEFDGCKSECFADYIRNISNHILKILERCNIHLSHETSYRTKLVVSNLGFYNTEGPEGLTALILSPTFPPELRYVTDRVG